jgi:hypothetical protein
MKLLMKNWKRFLTENTQHIRVSVSRDVDKENLISLARGISGFEGWKDWDGNLILSFDSPKASDEFTNRIPIGFSAENATEDVNAVLKATGDMGIQSGEGDVRHTRAYGEKYKTKWTKDIPDDQKSRDTKDIVSKYDTKKGYIPYHKRKRTEKELPAIDPDEMGTLDTVVSPPPSMNTRKTKA